jgi:hypothetical protein
MMFRKFLLAALFFVLLYNDASGQSLTVDSYANQMLFNVFKEQPDPAVQEFLKMYIPSMLNKKTGAQPTGDNKFKLESHTFVFLEHPHFKTAFTNGKLEFDCRRYNDARGVQVDDVHLCFNFDTQQEAETAFSQMVDALKPISPKNYIHSANGAMIGEFTDTKNTKGFAKVAIYLTTDSIDKTKFRLLFLLGNSIP